MQKTHTHEFEVSLSSASLSAFQQFHENPPKNSNSRMSFYGIPRHDCTTLQLQGGLEGISFFKTKAGHQDVSNSEAPHRLLDENWHLWKRVRNGTDSWPNFGNSPGSRAIGKGTPNPAAWLRAAKSGWRWNQRHWWFHFVVHTFGVKTSSNPGVKSMWHLKKTKRN